MSSHTDEMSKVSPSLLQCIETRNHVLANCLPLIRLIVQMFLKARHAEMHTVFIRGIIILYPDDKSVGEVASSLQTVSLKLDLSDVLTFWGNPH